MKQSMKAIVYRGPGKMEIEELPVPEIADDGVLVRTKYAAICGGELHTYRCGYGDPEGSILGHEFIGFVEKAGSDVKGLKVGDRVWGMSADVCGTCWYCENGDYAHCSNVLKYVSGHGEPGGMAQMLVIRHAALGQNIHIIPESITDKQAALVEPFSVGCAEVSEAAVQPGDKVVVIGCGMIGNSIIQFAKLAGAESIIAVDVSDVRLEMAARCGADEIVNSMNEDVLAAVQRIWGENRWFFGESGRADVVFETAGVASTVNDAVAAVKAGGKLVLVAPSERDVSLNLGPLINKAPKVIIPVTGAYAVPTIEAMAAGKLVVDPLIAEVFPLERAAEAFAAQSDPNNGMKMLIEMN